MHNQLLVSKDENERSFEEKIKSVTSEEVQQLCQRAQLDTIYVMTKEGESHA